MKYVFALSLLLLLSSCTSVSKQDFSKIIYRAGPCFGTCPMFTMTINKDQSAVIDAEHFTFTKGGGKDDFSKEKEGKYTARITDSDYRTLVSMLNALNVNTLNEKYGSRNVTDLSTAYLTVHQTDGSVKKVEDYGKSGTPLLKQLYNFLEDLRFTQKWTKAAP